MADWKDGLKPETVAVVEFFLEGVEIYPDELKVTEQPDGGILISWKTNEVAGLPV